MKNPLPQDKPNRFKGSLRHYHRAGSQTQRPWEEWVDGFSAKGGKIYWLKILGILVAVLALVGIITGLIIELR